MNMNKIKKHILWLLFGLPTIATATDAKNMVVTPEFVVATALQYADEIALIENELTNLRAAEIRIDANFLTTIDGRLAISDNRAESIQPFSPERSRGKTLTLGASRLFETGTTVRGEIQGNHRNTEYAAASPAEGSAYDTGLMLSLRQSLWRNAFGRTLNQKRAALKYGTVATEASVADRRAQYAVQASSMFFNAWRAIAQVRAAERRLERQRVLFRVTRIKFDRGTTEQPDYLQVDAGVTLMEDRVKEARNIVEDIWIQLVSLLKLPDVYAKMDPMKVSINLGSAMSTVDASCKAVEIEDLSRTKAALAGIRAAETGLLATRSEAAPEVYVEARFASNGFDTDLGQSTKETAGGKHPHTTITIGFEMPLGYPRVEADALDALKQKNQAVLQLEKIRSQYKTERPILCEEIRRLQVKKESLLAVLKKQTQRAKLENERFQLGKVESFNVIQAENDVTDLQSVLDVLSAEMNSAAWQLLYLNDRIISYVSGPSLQTDSP